MAARGRGVSARAVVNLFDEAAVLLVNDAALDLERRRQLASVNREFVREQAHAADALVVGERGGESDHVPLDEPDGFGVAAPRDARLVLFGLRRGERRGERLPVGDDERGGLLAPRADDDDLADVLALFNQALDELRRDVLAVREFEEFLLAIRDVESPD